MKPELSFNRSVHLSKISTENYFIEFWDHHSGSKGAEITALRPGRAAGVLLRNITEIFAVCDRFLQLQTLFLDYSMQNLLDSYVQV